MERLSKTATEILNELHTERLDYTGEYIPLIDAINKLAEYEDLEEQGLIIKLPCKVGDKAYYVHREYLKDIDKWINRVDEVDSFMININLFVDVSFYIGGDRFRKTLTPYKTLFFTKAEAEKALAAMEKEK